MFKKVFDYLSNHKAVFVAVCMVAALLLSTILNFITSAIVNSNTREEKSESEEVATDNGSGDGTGVEFEETSILTDTQQAIVDLYTTDISTLVYALAAEYWVSDDLEHTLELTEEGELFYETSDGAVECTFAIVSASVSPQTISIDEKNATETDLTVLLDDGTYSLIRVYTYRVYNGEGNGASELYEYIELYSDLFDGEIFSNAYSYTNFSVNGLDDERLLAIIGEDAATAIENELRELVESSYPTFTSAAWSEYIAIDYAEATATLTFIITSESIEVVAEADEAGDTVTAVYSSFEQTVVTATVDLETGSATIS